MACIGAGARGAAAVPTARGEVFARAQCVRVRTAGRTVLASSSASFLRGLSGSARRAFRRWLMGVDSHAVGGG